MRAVPHPIRLVVSDDLKRNRLTVFFRLILVIPHLIWLTLWGIVVFFAVIVSWFATLFAGQTPLGLHNFIAQYIRYSTQVYGYLLFLADPYPGFIGDQPYGADLEVDPPAPQNRWITGFRLIVAIPGAHRGRVLGYLMTWWRSSPGSRACSSGAMPLGLRNLTAWIVRFTLRPTATCRCSPTATRASRRSSTSRKRRRGGYSGGVIITAGSMYSASSAMSPSRTR